LYSASGAGDSAFERVEHLVRNHLHAKYVKDYEMDFSKAGEVGSWSGNQKHLSCINDAQIV
jgi:hypothetical protein